MAFCCHPLSKSVSDRKSTRLNSSHLVISYAVFCLKKKKKSTVVLHLASSSLRRPATAHTSAPCRARSISYAIADEQADLQLASIVTRATCECIHYTRVSDPATHRGSVTPPSPTLLPAALIMPKSPPPHRRPRPPNPEPNFDSSTLSPCPPFVFFFF